MSGSQLAYSPYHLEGKVNFEGVRNVMPWAANVERRKRVKCYVQGSGRWKRKMGVGRGSGSPDSTRISSLVDRDSDLGLKKCCSSSIVHRTVDSMDENMIRLLLKDQADAAEKQAQQHATTFQMQFDALRAELHATRGLLQTRYEGGGDLGSTLPLAEGGRVQLGRCGFRMVSMDGKEWVNYRLGQIYRKWIKLNLQRKLLVSKPTTLGDTFSLARIAEARLDDQAVPATV
ncbi:hypothetical protein Tco_1056554 [Tanacetum coccineum]|uniref:Uncharacterized protein n=1 Tax=Tanacetum coccineum TaxID=301880 RepID=A0ABQ5H4N7_9ASTR